MFGLEPTGTGCSRAASRYLHLITPAIWCQPARLATGSQAHTYPWPGTAHPSPDAALLWASTWMTRDELAQAIPPAYTEHIGRQLIAELVTA